LITKLLQMTSGGEDMRSDHSPQKGEEGMTRTCASRLNAAAAAARPAILSCANIYVGDSTDALAQPLATGGVFAAAPYLHDVRFLSFFAVFATEFAIRLGRAIASRMRALSLALFFGHGRTSFKSGRGRSV
jgi:hypothetical protein